MTPLYGRASGAKSKRWVTDRSSHLPAHVRAGVANGLVPTSERPELHPGDETTGGERCVCPLLSADAHRCARKRPDCSCLYSAAACARNCQSLVEASLEFAPS